MIAILSILEAATLLDVSTSYLISLLDAGKIPFVQVGVDQRLLFSDLMAYKTRYSRRSIC